MKKNKSNLRRYFIGKLIKRILFILFLIILNYIFIIKKIIPIFYAKNIIINYGLHSFDICIKYPIVWKNIKRLYIITSILAASIVGNSIYSFIFKYNSTNITPPHIKTIKPSSNTLHLLIGYNYQTRNNLYLLEPSLYQNILITGTIGSGKTSSAMYPYTKQLIEYNYKNPSSKLGMLILDVKGNYHYYIKNLAKKYNIENDLIIIELNSKITYNPLHKPYLKPHVLANRLITILNLFSPNTTESYWLDKAEQILSESIKLCRLYNNNYVTFTELHKLITFPSYYEEKINTLKNKFTKNKLTPRQLYELNSAIDFFQKEYWSMDQRTLSILKSEITRITNIFISDYDVQKTFCPSYGNITFNGFRSVLDSGKIVILNMNIAVYKNLSKIIAAYLKLDFQFEVISRISKYNTKPCAFICDEYSEYVTKTDSDFFSLSREAKCINIISTQSYSSLKNTLKDETSVKVIIQSLVNKLWFRSDDIFTIEEVQKQLGKEDKIKTSRNISENAKETNYNYITNSFVSHNSNISESLNTYVQTEFKYDITFFSQELHSFEALAFLSNGTNIIPPCKLKMNPYFKNS